LEASLPSPPLSRKGQSRFKGRSMLLLANKDRNFLEDHCEVYLEHLT